jgi:hypothetical protein
VEGGDSDQPPCWWLCGRGHCIKRQFYHLAYVIKCTCRAMSLSYMEELVMLLRYLRSSDS